MLQDRGLALGVALLSMCIGFGTQAFSQALPPNLPTKEDLARDNNLFLSLARKYLKWDEPAETLKIAEPIRWTLKWALPMLPRSERSGIRDP